MSDKCEQWPAESVEDWTATSFLDRFPTVAVLHQFFEDVVQQRDTSAWPFAMTIARSVFEGRATTEGVAELGLDQREIDKAMFALENRYMLEGERAEVFQNRLFRAIGVNGGLKNHKFRYAVTTFTGLHFQDVCFVMVLQQTRAGSPLDGKFHLYRVPNEQQVPALLDQLALRQALGSEDLGMAPAPLQPIATYPVRSLLNIRTAMPSLEELACIFRGSNGRGGYAWGDTRGAAGNFSAETLTALIVLGYAVRTGEHVPNGLGGSWPEVEVTEPGVQALMQSNVLAQQQSRWIDEGVSCPTASLTTTPWGELEFCARTGTVLGGAGGAWLEGFPVRIDVARLNQADVEIQGEVFELEQVGYWTASGRYVAATEELENGCRMAM